MSRPRFRIYAKSQAPRTYSAGTTSIRAAPSHLLSLRSRHPPRFGFYAPEQHLPWGRSYDIRETHAKMSRFCGQNYIILNQRTLHEQSRLSYRFQ